MIPSAQFLMRYKFSWKFSLGLEVTFGYCEYGKIMEFELGFPGG